MSQYSDPNLKFCGSHAGVSIGEDGPSQMGLEDLAMFRAILDSVVLYPCRRRLHRTPGGGHGPNQVGIVLSAHHPHGHPHPLRPGGESSPSAAVRCCVRVRQDVVTVVGAGVTLFEALAGA